MVPTTAIFACDGPLAVAFSSVGTLLDYLHTPWNGVYPSSQPISNNDKQYYCHPKLLSCYCLNKLEGCAWLVDPWSLVSMRYKCQTIDLITIFLFLWGAYAPLPIINSTCLRPYASLSLLSLMAPFATGLPLQYAAVERKAPSLLSPLPEQPVDLGNRASGVGREKVDDDEGVGPVVNTGGGT